MIPSPEPKQPEAPYVVVRTANGIRSISLEEMGKNDEVIYAMNFRSMVEAESMATLLRNVAEFDDQPSAPVWLPEEKVIELIQDTDSEIHQAEIELDECKRLARELTK